MSKKEQYLLGAKAALPVILGFVSAAIAYAILAMQAGLPVWQIILMSILVFAGASQMIAVNLLVEGAAVPTIVFATFILNFKNFIMSTCVMNHMSKSSVRSKILASLGVTDESLVLFTSTQKEKYSVFYFLGIITVMYFSFVFGTAIGCFAAQLMPEVLAKSFGISLYAMFIGILVPSVKGNKKMVIVVMATALMSFVLNNIFSSAWAIILSIVAGAAFGVWLPKSLYEKTLSN